MRSTLVGPPMAESLVPGQQGSGKNGDVLDSTDVTADRPKNTSGHSAAPQTKGRKDSLAAAGTLPRGQTRIFITAQEGSWSRGGIPDKRPIRRSRRHGTSRCLICITYPRKMMDNSTTERYGARPFGIHRGGRVPGPQPQNGPPSATGGHITLLWTAWRRGARGKATGPKPSTTRARKVNILQWNSKGVYNKKITLVVRLHEDNTEIAYRRHTWKNHSVSTSGDIRYSDRTGKVPCARRLQ